MKVECPAQTAHTEILTGTFLDMASWCQNCSWKSWYKTLVLSCGILWGCKKYQKVATEWDQIAAVAPVGIDLRMASSKCLCQSWTWPPVSDKFSRPVRGNRHDVNNFAVQTRWVQGLRNCKMESNHEVPTSKLREYTVILERYYCLHEWKKTISYNLLYTSEMLRPTKVVFYSFLYSVCFLRVIMKKHFCVLKLFGTGQVALPFQKASTPQLCWSICQVNRGNGIHFPHRHRKTWGKGRHKGLQSFPCYDFG